MGQLQQLAEPPIPDFSRIRSSTGAPGGVITPRILAAGI
jgi:hypothetical protein